jgi:hypothetical protein
VVIDKDVITRNFLQSTALEEQFNGLVVLFVDSVESVASSSQDSLIGRTKFVEDLSEGIVEKSLND